MVIINICMDVYAWVYFDSDEENISSMVLL